MTGLAGARVLVTGATGCLGAELVAQLMASGAEVTCLLRASSDLTRVPAPRILRLAPDLQGIITQVAQAAPDVILHCAGKVQTDHRPDEVEALFQANVHLGTALAEAAVRCGTKSMVAVGTYLEHDSTGAIHPTSFYAATKRAQVDMLRFYAGGAGAEGAYASGAYTNGACTITWVKPSVIYGDTEHRPRLVSLLVRAAQSGAPVDLSPGQQVMNFIHVSDAARALIQAAQLGLDRPKPELTEYFATTGDTMTIRALAALIETRLGRPVHAVWGARPYKAAEVFAPFVTGDLVPGWQPKITVSRFLDDLADRAKRLE